MYARFRYSGKNPMRFAVFWRISVRFCGFRTPLTPPSFVCTELVSLIWFLQIWVAISGTMISLFTLIKKLMQTYIVIVSGSIVNVSTVHLNGIWHLIWRYLSKPVLDGHPVLSGHYSIPRGCPPNTGFTVFAYLNVINNVRVRACFANANNNLLSQAETDRYTRTKNILKANTCGLGQALSRFSRGRVIIRS